jgi:hypothetical protein
MPPFLEERQIETAAKSKMAKEIGNSASVFAATPAFLLPLIPSDNRIEA